MKFYFVRHGRASQVAPSDALRPLTPDGVAHVERLGAVLSRMGETPTRIYASPRVRAQETATILANALGQEVVTSEVCNFDFSLEGAFDLVRGMDDDAAVMFVGHNPSMSAVAGEACGARVDLNPGAIACVTRIMPQYTSMAVLRWLLTPKVVSGLMDED